MEGGEAKEEPVEGEGVSFFGCIGRRLGPVSVFFGFNGSVLLRLCGLASRGLCNICIVASELVVSVVSFWKCVEDEMAASLSMVDLWLLPTSVELIVGGPDIHA